MPPPYSFPMATMETFVKPARATAFARSFVYVAIFHVFVNADKDGDEVSRVVFDRLQGLADAVEALFLQGDVVEDLGASSEHDLAALRVTRHFHVDRDGELFGRRLRVRVLGLREADGVVHQIFIDGCRDDEEDDEQENDVDHLRDRRFQCIFAASSHDADSLGGLFGFDFHVAEHFDQIEHFRFRFQKQTCRVVFEIGIEKKRGNGDEQTDACRPQRRGDGLREDFRLGGARRRGQSREGGDHARDGSHQTEHRGDLAADVQAVDLLHELLGLQIRRGGDGLLDDVVAVFNVVEGGAQDGGKRGGIRIARIDGGVQIALGKRVLNASYDGVRHQLVLFDQEERVVHRTHVNIGIAPFAAHKGKIYPTEQMQEVISELTKRYPKARIFLFGRGKEEEEVFPKWEKMMPQCTCVSWHLDTMDQELILMSHLDVMVSMDSANMHLASLTGTPVVSIWGATHPMAGFLGWNQHLENAVQLNLDCRPCSIYGQKPCIHGDFRCMTGIKPEMILEKITKIINPLKQRVL